MKTLRYGFGISVALARGTCVAAAAWLIGPAAAAPTSLVVEAGILIGAKNVVVNGSDYDVEFVDGTCATVYGQCAPSAFTFSYDNAVAATWALLESVFIDSAAGSYDSEPSRTRGCVHEPLNFGYSCMAYTAAYFEREGVVTSAVAINQPSPSQFTDWVIGTQTGVNEDFSPYITQTWAVWRPSEVSASVPEPGTLELAFGALSIVVVGRLRNCRLRR